MIIGIVTSILLVLICILIHYETFRILSSLSPGPSWIGLRGRRGAAVLACFAAHTIEVWLFAGAFYLLADRFVLNGVAGVQPLGFADLVYFSVVTYSTIGIGDLFPMGAARLITGVEAIVGLLLIGWSATFTCLVMGRYWPLHPTRQGSELPAEPAASRLWRRELD